MSKYHESTDDAKHFCIDSDMPVTLLAPEGMDLHNAKISLNGELLFTVSKLSAGETITCDSPPTLSRQIHFQWEERGTAQ